MKKFELGLNLVLLPIDYIFLVLAGLISYYLRFDTFVTDIRPVLFSMSLSDFLDIVYLLALGWIFIFSLSGLYSFKRRPLVNEIKQIFFSCSTATMIIIVAFFIDTELFSSRFIILAFWILSIVLISLERTIFFFIKKAFYKGGYGVNRVVVIGQDNNTFNLISEYKKNPSYGFRVIEHLNQFTEKEADYLTQLRGKLIIDDVIQSDVNLPADQKEFLFNYCQQNQLGFKYVASLLQTKMINFDINTLSGIPLIEIRHTKLEGWGRIFKRFYDLVGGFVGCLILIPLSIVIGILIKIDSRGPVFVKLKRVGYRGREFNLYKFRSMVVNAHQLKKTMLKHNERVDGPLFKMKNDPRITTMGKILRSTSIDELPQIFNVLKGDMSLVGPRPHEPEEVAKYKKQQRKLFNIKPGMTGAAQVAGRSDLLFEEEVKLDSYYIENWSVWLDIQILIKTIFVVLFRKGVA